MITSFLRNPKAVMMWVAIANLLLAAIMKH
ncbi:hypothetical protein NITLEN_100024 [Nitrospira lenta]|uniref:Uncharacterized protein n=1 Tax=Nitrospira lenta TaxID=1436998 RepID=A0A330LAX9_9BACT|nr:hypothetical protein NITLEN_100024 [Nitrospira lenta]